MSYGRQQAPEGQHSKLPCFKPMVLRRRSQSQASSANAYMHVVTKLAAWSSGAASGHLCSTPLHEMHMCRTARSSCLAIAKLTALLKVCKTGPQEG